MEAKPFNRAFFVPTLAMFCILVLQLFSSVSFGAVINVPADQPTIQAAIDAASSGDEIIVAPGSYYENIVFPGFDIILRSTDPTNSAVVDATIIDGGGYTSVVTFAGSEGPSCVLAGFTITNGTTDVGGGILGNGCLATIAYNNVTDNGADWGGGIGRCDGSIRNNTIYDNYGYYAGGGIYDCSGTIEHNTITGNEAYYDGGGLASCEGTIQNNTIAENWAYYGDGGGLYDCDALIQDNIIVENYAYYYDGGGLAYCDGLIQNNVIAYNYAGWYGGGLVFCNGTILNNTIFYNHGYYGGGGLGGCAASIINCIVYYNTGNFAVGIDEYNGYSGDYGIDPVEVAYCDVYGHTYADYWDYDTGLAYFGLNINTIPDGLVHDCISADPQLVDPSNGDYHLRLSSPCIDAGEAVTLSKDYEGDARPFDAGYAWRGDGSHFDIGADEFTVGRKWAQPPNMIDGFDVESWCYTELPEPAIADDSLCTFGEPIVHVRWWGSYIGWENAVSEPVEPPGGLDHPIGFLLSWHEYEAEPYSHPGALVEDLGIGMGAISEVWYGAVPLWDEP
jgi:hypothetical protein